MLKIKTTILSLKLAYRRQNRKCVDPPNIQPNAPPPPCPPPPPRLTKSLTAHISRGAYVMVIITRFLCLVVPSLKVGGALVYGCISQCVIHGVTNLPTPESAVPNNGIHLGIDSIIFNLSTLPVLCVLF